MNIQIIDAHVAELDHLQATLARAMRFAHEADSAKIVCQPRVPLDAPAYQHPGWLEYTLEMLFQSGCRLTMGVIQRKPGEPVEFHS